MDTESQPPPVSKLTAKSRWQNAASTVLINNKIKKNVDTFLNVTMRSVNASNTHVRHDVVRLREALTTADTAVIEFLIKRNRANLHTELDVTTGDFPIHVAAAALRDPLVRDHASKMLRWLIDEQKVDIEATDGLGRSVLHVAANASDDPKIILLLLARGADPRAQTPTGDSASDMAKLQRHAKAKAVLDAAVAVDNSIWFAHEHPSLPQEFLPQLQELRNQIDWGSRSASSGAPAVREGVTTRPSNASNEVSPREGTLRGSRLPSSNASRPALREQSVPESEHASVHPSRGASRAASFREPSLEPPLSQSSSMASVLATKLQDQAQKTQWEPPPYLKVVQRANAAAMEHQRLEDRASRAAHFIGQLRRRNLGAGSPYLMEMTGDV